MNDMTVPSEIQVLCKRIDEIGLSGAAVNCLSRKGDNIIYVSDLVQKSEAELCRIPNLGRKALMEINHTLHKMRLHLDMNIPKMEGLDRTNDRKSHKERSRIRKIHRQFGLTEEDIEKLLIEQGGKCAICQKADIHLNGGYGPAVDHCHKTGKFRGILCNGCNTGIGMFKDDPETLIRAAEYLRQRSSENWIGNQREGHNNIAFTPEEKSEWWLRKREQRLQKKERRKLYTLRRRKMAAINSFRFRQQRRWPYSIDEIKQKRRDYIVGNFYTRPALP